MRFYFVFLILLSILAVQRSSIQVESLQRAGSPAEPTNKLTGRWLVKFSLTGEAEKHLVFEAGIKGSGFFRLLDTQRDDKPVVAPLPATWSLLTNDRVSFSGEAELPLGTCCRELGTLMFKGWFRSGNSLAGKLIFVTSVDEEESPYKFHSLVGTFTATRVTAK
jgi:hypothetical protein